MIQELDAPIIDISNTESTLQADAFVRTPPAAKLAACVVIPARDEADSIVRTLSSLASQRRLDGRLLDPASFEVILLANNCRDGTPDLAREWARAQRTLAVHVIELDLLQEQAHVGFARRLAMDEACRRLFMAGRPRGVIATTDGDTRVSPTWLAATLHEVEQGAEAVGGRILVAARERREMAPALRSRFLRHVGYGSLANEVTARIDPRPDDPWPCHDQFSGASLAVTARAYRRVGGLPPLPSSEDAALADVLRYAGIEIRHSMAVRVYTSSRLAGRAPDGMAALLASWSAMTQDGEPHPVPSASSVVARATGRRTLRDLWAQAQQHREVCTAEIARLANFAEVSEMWLHQAVLSAGGFGQLQTGFEQRASWQHSPDLVDIRVALDDLRVWLEPYRRPGALPPAFARHADGLPFVAPAHRGVLCSVPITAPDASEPLEQIQSVAALVSPLTTPPHVA